MQRGECRCPKIDLNDWRDREVTLAGHQFLATRTPLFLHVPHRFYRALEELESEVESRRFRVSGFPMVLHRDAWFYGEVLVSVEAQPGSHSEICSFQNLFYSRVVGTPGFDAALREMPKFYRDLRTAGVGPITSMYFWYLNCPGCLIERGAQGIILLAKSARILAADPCPMAPAARSQVLPCRV